MKPQPKAAAIDDRNRLEQADAGVGMPALDWSGRLALANRRFNAWWEGFEFDADAERQRLIAERFGDPTKDDPAARLSTLIWGEGRLDPGDPAWTMRHARLLGLPLKAKVAVFGAGRGAPLADLKAGTRWKLSGFTAETGSSDRKDLTNYDIAAARVDRASADGALCFFDMHRQNDPAALAQLMAKHLKPGAPLVVVDFTAPKKTYRLRGCFAAPLGGSAQTIDQLTNELTGAGFRVTDWSEETKIFLPLIASGWARWRRVWRAASMMQGSAAKAEYVRALGGLAHVWAERHDALQSGQLQVISMLARRS